MILETLAQFAPVILIVVFLLGMVIGLPITWALGITTVVTVAIDPGITFAVVGQKLFSSADNFAMLAVPGFFLAGDIMTAGGLSKKLVEFADSLVGWVTGGISLVAIVSCAFFAAISGSSAATTAAIGGIMYPEMVKRGYPSDYSTAVQAVGGTLGIIIPPSIVFVIYGSTNGRVHQQAADVRHAARHSDRRRAVRIRLCGSKERELPQVLRSVFSGTGLQKPQGRHLGPDDAPDHSGRHLRRHFHPDGVRHDRLRPMA